MPMTHILGVSPRRAKESLKNESFRGAPVEMTGVGIWLEGDALLRDRRNVSLALIFVFRRSNPGFQLLFPASGLLDHLRIELAESRCDDLLAGGPKTIEPNEATYVKRKHK